MPKLNKWAVVPRPSSPYEAPEQWREALIGEVTGHHRIADNEPITTSHVVGLRNGLVVTSSGSEYELLEVAPEYEKQFPNARNRLFASLKILS